jgi:hypothetical protein
MGDRKLKTRRDARYFDAHMEISAACGLNTKISKGPKGVEAIPIRRNLARCVIIRGFWSSMVKRESGTVARWWAQSKYCIHPRRETCKYADGDLGRLLGAWWAETSQES